MKSYDHKKIEKKWQERWDTESAYRAEDDSSKPKDYLLIEFPYPSGDGLHVGHVRSYTAMDVIARKRRAQGRNVLYPIGWDAFGLPTENYALKTGKDPRIVTKENSDNFRRQIKSLGLSFDWSREINTTDPSYYKWTQWIFLQLYKKGLAYKAKTLINWCPKDKIGLANEEVIDGKCERCGTLVVKREKEQWMMAITKYAQRLYDDLDLVDYIERAKTQQRNWIGPSEGAEIEFAIKDSKEKIKVFTTRPDTLYGATYLVLAPEHRIIATLCASQTCTNRTEVDGYVKSALNLAEIERTIEGKEKTGVELKGVKAINPASKEEIPIYVADYVLGGYGTGAIMAVPAHDERDYAFAKKFNIPMKRVIEPIFRDSPTSPAKPDLPMEKRDAVCVIVRDPADNAYLCIQWKGDDHMHGLVTGGIEAGEDLVEAAKREVAEETGYKNLRRSRDSDFAVHSLFFHRKKMINRWARFRYVFLELENEERNLVDEKEAALHEVVWKRRDELNNFFSVIEGEFILNFIDNPDYIYTGEGILANSGEFDGLDSQDAKKKITKFVGGKIVTTFKLRDWVFSRQRYWGEPIPMIYCEKDGWVAVPEDQLPVLLPEVEKYQPTDTGESPLANIHEWVNTICPTCGGSAKRETDVMPNWAGSSWYYLRYTDPSNDKEFAAQENLKYWLTPASPSRSSKSEGGVDWYNGGMEHTVLHLLYSRFWHKFLFDQGLVPTPEPYMKRTSHGLILAEDGSKMSKSKGNTVSPDVLVENVGADALRLYEMFLGPFDQPVSWNSNGVVGMRRFLERVADLAVNDETKLEPALETLLHQTIKKVTEDIENLKLNTALSSLMILLNECEKTDSISTEVHETFLKLLAPFAPHLTHELWEQSGHDTELRLEPWPVADERKLKGTTAHIAIQINGKTRGEMEAPIDADKTVVENLAREAVAKYLEGKTVSRVIVVPNRLVNFVLTDTNS
ncbi:MAG TPA: class I tRNA ligase family protein [Candidatus Paceibacterota bacterium]|nr:class I tRNA ligase family protein [Candidatus Paceibacterota bacterium]